MHPSVSHFLFCSELVFFCSSLLAAVHQLVEMLAFPSAASKAVEHPAVCRLRLLFHRSKLRQKMEFGLV